MNEEKDLLSPAQQSETTSAGQTAQPEQATQTKKPNSRSASRSQQRRQQRSVFQYIAILFAAAFILLLFTFAMEKRQYEMLQQQSEAQIDDLQQSVSAVQSLQKLYDENAALKEQVDTLEDQLKLREEELAATERQSAALTDKLAKTGAAMDWFWQIDEAYVRGRYSLCRSLIQNLESAGLVDYLPRESATANGRFAPYDRYQEIYEAVN